MKHSSPFSLGLLIIFLVSIACNISVPSTSAPTPTETPTAPVIPTNTALPPTDTPVALVTAEVLPTATIEPEVLPEQPVGYYVVPPGSGTIVVYDQQNQVITQLSAPGLYGDNPAYAHLVGRLSNSSQDFSAVFFSWESFSLNISNLNGMTPLFLTPNFYMLTGIPAQPYIAYVNVEYGDAGLISSLIAGDVGTLASAPVTMTVVNSDWYAVRPLAVSHDQGQPLGIYYTSVPYGIGGDIVFEPRSSLNYLELSTNLSREVLGIGLSPVGISPDLTWAAYTPTQTGPLNCAPIAALGSPVTLPLLPDSNRGAGAAVFSPDNQYIAWKEGSGWMMSETPDFHATIRIATTSGSITAQIPDSAMSTLIGNPNSIWIEPVGWLDNNTLLIEVRGDDWEQASLLQVNPDGSGLAYRALGSFMGFIYP